jgi:C1A family cysteine protease
MDPQSWLFTIEEELGTDRVSIHSMQTTIWTRFSPVLDQGQLGSCTGNALTGLLATHPFTTTSVNAGLYDEAFAVERYHRGTMVDKAPGTYPPDDTGSTGNSVAKAARQDSLISKYAWATTLKGVIHALQVQPVIVGVAWYDSFFTPDSSGVIDITSGAQIAGGHEFEIVGVDMEKDMFLCYNSWGSNWGLKGRFLMPFSIWEDLMTQQADCTIPHKL